MNKTPMISARVLALQKILYQFFDNYLDGRYTYEDLLFLLTKNSFDSLIPQKRNSYFKDNTESKILAFIPDLVENVKKDLESSNSMYLGYCYECSDENDLSYYIVLAFEVISHHLKPARCLHCGKWYFTDNLKQKYCKGESPYPGYTHLECEKAVKNIKQQLRRKRNGIYSYLYKYRNENDVNSFLQKMTPYFDKLKTEPSITNFRICDIVCNSYDYLKKEKVKK